MAGDGGIALTSVPRTGLRPPDLVMDHGRLSAYVGMTVVSPDGGSALEVRQIPVRLRISE